MIEAFLYRPGDRIEIRTGGGVVRYHVVACTVHDGRFEYDLLSVPHGHRNVISARTVECCARWVSLMIE